MIDFSTALIHLKAGQAVARASQAERGAAVVLIPGITIAVTGKPLSDLFGDGAKLPVMPFFALAVSGVLIPWQPTAADISASDWDVTTLAPPRRARKTKR